MFVIFYSLIFSFFFSCPSVACLWRTGLLGLIVLCRSVSPVVLISHLPVLCQLHRTPLLTLHTIINAKMMAQAIRQQQKNTEGETTITDAEMDVDDGGDKQTSAAKSSGRRHLQLCSAIGIYVSEK